MKLFKTFIVMLMVAVPAVSNAYVLDPTSSIVTDDSSGKQWLRWTETSSLSVNSAISTYQGDGWRLASNAEMAKLFSDFFAPIVLPEDQASRQSFVGEFGDGEDPVLELGKTFGWTEYENSINVASGETLSLNDYSTSIVKFGSASSGGASLYNSLTISSEFTFGRDDELIGRPERATLDFNQYTGIANGNERIGVALVREIPTSEVPEPSGLFLLGLGLMGLVYTRKKECLARA
ncbi:PEP-CTERM sorting domain-containing protein [Oleiphilus sp. HI0079]|uniref:PEP-CTERM sorting domain-containing protein n=2 Tax=unclassified Oleiphilus TaxID=2631174 RepID=UPI0007C3AA13|nr:PEP-CTERM sorting domain-containing protein [Oleiphilus sp. HI0079]KZY64702.1 hypothetical protein A3737_13960 [Oleiphilus sp. HI0065]KZZ80953.1 hypothetical protein A3767_09545 [Oleiphilus sp. HI0133]